MKVLVVEDNHDLSSNILQFLNSVGYVCESAANLGDAQNKLSSFQYDCIILDIMLPDGSGLELFAFIKELKIETSILIISAKNSLDDKVYGLEAGADDYLTKPFHLPELHARLKAIYRRKNLRGDNIVTVNEISVNTNTLEVKVNGTIIDVTRKEYEMLLYFLVNKNRVVTKQSIAEHLWGDYTDNLANVDFVYQHIKNLRKKITAANGRDYISTVYGIGYKFQTDLQ
jgi:DNA-binding response OmpR family regulator